MSNFLIDWPTGRVDRWLKATARQEKSTELADKLAFALTVSHLQQYYTVQPSHGHELLQLHHCYCHDAALYFNMQI